MMPLSGIASRVTSIPRRACSFESPPPLKVRPSAANLSSSGDAVSFTRFTSGSLKPVRNQWGTSDPVSTRFIIVAFTKGRDFCIEPVVSTANPTEPCTESTQRFLKQEQHPAPRSSLPPALKSMEGLISANLGSIALRQMPNPPKKLEHPWSAQVSFFFRQTQ